MSKKVITKEKINKMRKKMMGEELEKYYDEVKKSAHVHRNKKKYHRKSAKRKWKEENYE